jgi:hypothetical protein
MRDSEDVRHLGFRSFYGTLCRGVVFALVSVATPSAMGGDNLLRNPSFRNGSADWSPLYGGFQIVSDDEVGNALFMKRAGEWRADSERSTDLYGGYQVHDFDKPTSEDFRISCRAKSSGITRGPSFPQYFAIRVDFECENGKTFSESALHIPFDGDDTWRTHEVVVRPIWPVVRMKTQILFWNCNGSVWFTDVKVEIAPMTVQYFNAATDLFDKGSVEVRAYGRKMTGWEIELASGSRTVASSSGSGPEPVRVSFPTSAWKDHGFGSVPEAACVTLRMSFVNGESVKATETVLFRDCHPRQLVLWTEGSTDRIFPSSLPPPRPTPPPELPAAGGEAVSFQLGILADRLVKDIRVTATDLESEGGKTISSDQVAVYQVGCVLAVDQMPHPSMVESVPSWFPDPMMEVDTFDIEPSWAQPVVVRIRVPEGTSPGIYRGVVKVASSVISVSEIPFVVRVHSFSIPTRNSLPSLFTNWSRFDKYRYCRSLFPNADPKKLAGKVDHLLLDYRIEPFWIQDGVIDEEDLQRLGDRAGTVCLGAIHAGAGMAIPSEQMRDDKALQEKLDKEFDEEMRSVQSNLSALRKAGFTGRTYLYGYDEQSFANNAAAGRYFGKAKCLLPEIPTLSTMRIERQAKAMAEVGVDELVVFLPLFNQEESHAIRASGKKVWAYVMCEEPDEYPQFNLHNPLIDSRILFWMAYQQEFDGLLYWGSSIWTGNSRPIDCSRGARVEWSVANEVAPWIHGDGRLCYPDARERPMASLRMLNICEGFQDYEYLKLLEDVKGRKVAMDEAGRIVRSTRKFTRDSQSLRDAKERIARMISGED